MPRTSRGPRLRLFGPDTRFGAKPRKGFTAYRWYVVWQDNNGQRRERATGLGHGATPEELEQALSQFLFEQNRHRIPSGAPRAPENITVAEVLARYGEAHAPTCADPARIGQAIENLARWWKEAPLSSVTPHACRRYSRERKTQISTERDARRHDADARYRLRGKQPPPRKEREISDGTARIELSTLAAAIRWCHREGYLLHPPAVWLPPSVRPRERWLTREEAAQLVRAARNLDARAGHLALFILIGLYTGARKEAILGLQWQPNTAGGWVDLVNNCIDFRKAGHSQTKKRRAVIPIPPRLLRFLKTARNTTRQHVLEYRGNRIGNIKHSFASAVQKAGLGDDVVPHTLRHSAVTWMVQSGRVPLWDIGQWVGMSPAMIERVYGHHDPKKFDRVLMALA